MRNIALEKEKEIKVITCPPVTHEAQITRHGDSKVLGQCQSQPPLIPSMVLSLHSLPELEITKCQGQCVNLRRHSTLLSKSTFSQSNVYDQLVHMIGDSGDIGRWQHPRVLFICSSFLSLSCFVNCELGELSFSQYVYLYCFLT